MLNKVLSILMIFFIASGCKQESINHEAVKLAESIDIKVTQAFDKDLSELPENYSGVDVAEFYRIMDNASDKLRKTEFETSKEHNARLKANSSDSIKPLSQENLYAFLLREIRLNYDADLKRYVAHYSCFDMRKKGGVDCLVGTLTKNLGEYVGESAFGVKARVKEVREEKIYLRFNKSSMRNSSFKFQDGFIYSLNISCNATADKAIKLKDSEMSVLFVGRLTSPQMINLDIEYLRPKIGDYDPKSGKVYHEAIPFELTEIICFAKKTGEIIERKKVNK